MQEIGAKIEIKLNAYNNIGASAVIITRIWLANSKIYHELHSKRIRILWQFWGGIYT